MVQRFYGNADGSLFSSVSVHAKGVRVFAGCEIERATSYGGFVFGGDKGRPEGAVGQQVL